LRTFFADNDQGERNMATTDVTLYRSLIGDAAKLRVRKGVPDSGMLDPRWQDTPYETRDGKKMVSRADVRIVRGTEGPEVDNNGKGTSLHDVSGWFGNREFVIPEGTTYSDEILIVKDDKLKTNPKGTVSGYHYMLTARTRMAPITFKGYLDNMAREAVAMQVRAASTKK
jgi:hypothetical protein